MRIEEDKSCWRERIFIYFYKTNLEKKKHLISTTYSLYLIRCVVLYLLNSVWSALSHLAKACAPFFANMLDRCKPFLKEFYFLRK